MNSKKLSLVWTDGLCVDITLLDTPASQYYYGCIKHLQHVDLEFNSRKNPLHPDRCNLQTLSEQILVVGKKLNVNVDLDQLTNQPYLNQLHNQYFDSTDGKGCDDTDWLRFHDLIHVIEDANKITGHEAIWFDYEQRAGPLIKSFDQSWLKYSVSKIPVGLCYLQAHELGKTVKKYFKDQEPFDLPTMCKIMKPWVDLKPVMNLAVTDQDRQHTLDRFKQQYKTQLEQWELHYQKDWTTSWNLQDWSLADDGAALPIGHIKDMETVLKCFRNQNYPIRITY
jgi:hypothetical protein